MGKIDLDQHWPFPRSSVRLPTESAVTAAQPSAIPITPEGNLSHSLDDAYAAAGRQDYDLSKFEIRVDAPKETKALPRQRSLAPFIWGGAGFMAGMLAWHLVGFWNFLSHVVLNDNASRVATLSAGTSQPEAGLAGAPQPVSSTSAGAGGRCISLSIDRASGQTYTAHCSAQDVALRDAGFRPRKDRVAVQPRLQDPKAWSNTTAIESSPVETGSIETGTLREADFNLNLDR